MNGAANEEGRPVVHGWPQAPPRLRINLRRGGTNRNTLGEASVRVGGLVEIGEPERTYTVEPVEDPVPRERPGEPAEQPAGPSPAEVPVEPESVPAP